MTADKHPEDEIAVDLKSRFRCVAAWLVRGWGTCIGEECP